MEEAAAAPAAAALPPELCCPATATTAAAVVGRALPELPGGGHGQAGCGGLVQSRTPAAAAQPTPRGRPRRPRPDRR